MSVVEGQGTRILARGARDPAADNAAQAPAPAPLPDLALPRAARRARPRAGAPPAGTRARAARKRTRGPAAGAGAGGALGLTLGSIGGAANLNLRLSAAEDEGRVKIISAPKILTIDGKKATISQGVSIPISVVSANGVNTQFFNADLKLEVETSTSPDGNIRLDLDITKNEPDFGQTAANGAPTIQKKEAHTSLLVRDGDTTVIGGVYTRNTGSSSSGVPFLSKIPILGWFFQNHRESDSRSELLIFITPRVANRRASMVDSGTL
ncbi:MAG: type IV pilus secretin family protein, partial [Myxococcota bacterium]|nr:type IV pilus secretin family protein [Myxococcota bacterium]